MSSSTASKPMQNGNATNPISLRTTTGSSGETDDAGPTNPSPTSSDDSGFLSTNDHNQHRQHRQTLLSPTAKLLADDSTLTRDDKTKAILEREASKAKVSVASKRAMFEAKASESQVQQSNSARPRGSSGNRRWQQQQQPAAATNGHLNGVTTQRDNSAASSRRTSLSQQSGVESTQFDLSRSESVSSSTGDYVDSNTAPTVTATVTPRQSIIDNQQPSVASISIGMNSKKSSSPPKASLDFSRFGPVETIGRKPTHSDDSFDSDGEPEPPRQTRDTTPSSTTSARQGCLPGFDNNSNRAVNGHVNETSSPSTSSPVTPKATVTSSSSHSTTPKTSKSADEFALDHWFTDDLMSKCASVLAEESGLYEMFTVTLDRVSHGCADGGGIGLILTGTADLNRNDILVHKVITGSLADCDGTDRIRVGDRVLCIQGRVATSDLSPGEARSLVKAKGETVELVLARRRRGAPPIFPHSASMPVLSGTHRKMPCSPSDTQLSGVVASNHRYAHKSVTVHIDKTNLGLGFSLEGGKTNDGLHRPLTVKRVFEGGAAEKTGAMHVGDQVLRINDVQLGNLTHVEAWKVMKEVPLGLVSVELLPVMAD